MVTVQESRQLTHRLPPLQSPAPRPLQENQNEVVTVQGVSADGRTLYLAAPLQFQHYGWAWR